LKAAMYFFTESFRDDKVRPNTLVYNCQTVKLCFFLQSLTEKMHLFHLLCGFLHGEIFELKNVEKYSRSFTKTEQEPGDEVAHNPVW
jgi:hypothetical protein